MNETDSDEKVDHEEDVEGKIYLLGCVLQPRYAGLDTITDRKIYCVYEEQEKDSPGGIYEVNNQG